ncbi:MAG: two-component system OmpR family response regulator [Gammaproteobacteria bacterium]|jgi:two-component system OmpR family response regulator
MLNILVIEDDHETGEYLHGEFHRAGYSCVYVDTLASARAQLGLDNFAVVVLDRMLPDGDGIDFIREIRMQSLRVPVLVLSALGEVSHRVEGLRAGGDDYLVKPFDMDELIARIEVLSRRASSTTLVTEVVVADLKIDLLSQRVSRSGHEIRLQPREFKLLECLARHSGQVVTRTMLLETVWGLNFDPQTNVVDVHISRLRNKLDAEFSKPLLHTVRGKGYRLAPDP